MQIDRIPYSQTGKFSALVEDYLSNDESISSFFEHQPNLAGISAQLSAKKDFNPALRKTLVAALKSQYKRLRISENDYVELCNQIEKLHSSETFTVTTGHQLCLFTGPLYTVYKILHTIALADALNKKLAGKHIIPVFWMATEDHDFDEINHAYIGNSRVSWQHASGDAVGRLSTEGIEKSIDAIAQLLPPGTRTEQILADVRQAYAHQNLADATRALVHKWFGNKGLIIVDGDDASLKTTMIPAFGAEIIEQRAFQALAKTNARLAEKYPLQVAGRKINLFYLHNNNRYRLAPTTNGFEAVGGHKQFSEQSIIEELRAHPERFSPNVVLRPVYQEAILPNLAYIGGGGEVAYWAQLKEVFHAFEVPMPVVFLRQSVGILSAKHADNLKDMGFSIVDLFKPLHELNLSFLKKKKDYSTEIAVQTEHIKARFDALVLLAKEVDATLIKNAEAQKKQALRSIEVFEKKIWRAEARKENTHLNRLGAAWQQFSPSGGLQERKQNAMPFLQQFGYQWFDDVLEAIEPLESNFVIITAP